MDAVEKTEKARLMAAVVVDREDELWYSFEIPLACNRWFITPASDK